MPIGEKKLVSAPLVHLLDAYNTEAYWNGDIGYRAPGYGDFVIHTIKEIAIMSHNPKSVLDLGCAYGYSVMRLRQLGIDAYGVDISKLALSRCPDPTSPLYLVLAPLWQLPFADKAFDFAFSSGVLEHIPSDLLPLTIHEIKRVTKRGLFGIAVTDDETSNNDEDDTHSELKSVNDWQQLFGPDYDVISDSQVSWRVYATIRIREVLCRQ